MSSDPFSDGLIAYGNNLRLGKTTIAATTRYCFDRIEKYDEHLQAFQLLDRENALATAEALDALLASGTDLGPLMGVPLGVKDIIAVNNLPTTNGSLHQCDLPGPDEGPVMQRLRKAGCVVMGKTRTVEFALGATGLNAARGTPKNPWDWHSPRTPGGSSSGSAVSVAAGFVGFALGTDTGGSVRIPACFNGIYGHKTTVGRWSTDGVFPLSPSLDSIGPLCRNARDAALVHEVICGEAVAAVADFDARAPLAGVRFGIPSELYFDNLDDAVSATFEIATQRLKDAGAVFEKVSLPESHERATLFPKIVPPELLFALGREEFKKAAPKMDPVTRERAEAGLAADAIDYYGAQQRLKELAVIGEKALQGFDALVVPTCPFVPLEVAALQNEAEHQRSLLSSQNTQPWNLMRLCAGSLPIHHLNDDVALPVGLQVICKQNGDAELLQLSQRLQHVLGEGELPVLPG